MHSLRWHRDGLFKPGEVQRAGHQHRTVPHLHHDAVLWQLESPQLGKSQNLLGSQFGRTSKLRSHWLALFFVNGGDKYCDKHLRRVCL